MWYGIGITAGIFVGLVIAVKVLRALMRRYGGPSGFVNDRIEDSVKLMQAAAMRNIRPADGDKPARLDGEKFPGQVFVIDGVLRLTYSIESTPDEFRHVIASKLVGKRTEMYQMEAMLTGMLYMRYRFTRCEIDGDDIRESVGDYGAGEDYICLHLTPDQQEQFRRRFFGKQGA